MDPIRLPDRGRPACVPKTITAVTCLIPTLTYVATARASRPPRLPQCSYLRQNEELRSWIRSLQSFLLSGYTFKQRIRGIILMRLMSRRIALLCLLLTIWSAVALVTHHHSSATESAKCTVCVAAHSAAPKATSSLKKATFSPVATVQPEPVSAKQRLLAFSLSVRPPPQA
jgi:hypothetical protein